ncbi:alkene reductase [Pseudoalteromonas fenneropenaei]|uniref:Alkene reductase n=1 Tax=Pseudoalteromonas fenneropenaei TaxID=1737459 RepID=A0ABV7CME0_9GAMM
MNKLFQPVSYGNIISSNRFVMAPMSRNRATEDGCATAMMATYYGQRASAGLIISEGIQPNQVGQGFMNSPGLHNPAQAQSWRRVTQAVHHQGGKIVAQLMHAGRIGHPSLYPSAHQSLAPSAIAAKGEAYTSMGPQPYPTPKAMTKQDIIDTVKDFAQSAQYAIAAGFDGIEIHAGNGFLLHQFMATNCNSRDDEYGGSIDNRLRLTREVIAAVCEAIGAARVGVRISPENSYNDIAETDSAALYEALVNSLPKNLAYLHIMEAANRPQTEIIRALWQGSLILNPHKSWQDGPVSPTVAEQVLAAELCDGVAFGALFVANPDLVERVRIGAEFNELDSSKFYGGDEDGYTTYPNLQQTAALA